MANLKKRSIRSAYSARKRTSIKIDGPTRAKQSFKDSCDINKIVAKFQTSGIIDHVNKHKPNYGFCTSTDLKESLKLVETANTMFDELPAEIRKQFANNPAGFLDFVQDPANDD